MKTNINYRTLIKPLFILILVCISLVINGQTWRQIHSYFPDSLLLPSSQFETIDDLEPCINGDFISVGESTVIAPGEQPRILTRFDQNGNMLWTNNNWTGNNVNLDDFIAVMENPVSGDLFILTLYSSGFQGYNKDAGIVITDANGNLLSVKNYGDSNLTELPVDFEFTNDGGLIILSKVEENGNTKITKLDLQGNEEWSKVYNKVYRKTKPQSIAQTSSGKYIVSTIVLDSAFNSYATISDWLLILNNTGDTIFTKSFYHNYPTFDYAPFYRSGFSTLETQNKDIAIAFHADDVTYDQAIRFIRMDTLGNISIDNVFDFPEKSAAVKLKPLKENSDGSFVFTTGDIIQTQSLFHIDQNGNFLGSFISKNTIDYNDSIFYPSSCQESVNGYIVGGSCAVYESDTVKRVYPFVWHVDSLPQVYNSKVKIINVTDTLNGDPYNCNPSDTVDLKIQMLTTGYDVGDIISVNVDFGDGSDTVITGTVFDHLSLPASHFEKFCEIDIEHIYNYSGPFSVEVTVVDKYGVSGDFNLNLNCPFQCGYIDILYNSDNLGYSLVAKATGFDTTNLQGLTYAWSTGDSATINSKYHSIFSSNQGYYCVTVTDVNGCSIASCAQIDNTCLNFKTEITADVYPTIDSVTIITTPGFTSYNYAWDNGGSYWFGNDTLILGLNDGLPYCVTVSTLNCIATACTNNVVNPDSVYPGDTDANGVAHVSDVLNIGIGYGVSGPIRANASLNWVGQYATNWANSFVNTANYKHADCNGDGLIDSTDAAAILINYGLTHSKGEIDPPYIFTNPDIYLDLNIDTVNAGDTLLIPIKVGDPTSTIDSLYGLVFTINYDTSVAKPGVNLDFNPCWLGMPGVDLLTIQKERYSNGQIDIGMVRTDKNNISGHGEIAQIEIVTQDDLSGKTNIYKTLNFAFSNVFGITFSGDTMDFNVTSDSVVAQQSLFPTSTHSLMENDFNVFPNPSSGLMTIAGKNGPISEIEVSNLQGQLLYFTKGSFGHSANLDLDLPKGVYLLKVSSGSTSNTKRIMIK